MKFKLVDSQCWGHTWVSTTIQQVAVRVNLRWRTMWRCSFLRAEKCPTFPQTPKSRSDLYNHVPMASLKVQEFHKQTNRSRTCRTRQMIIRGHNWGKVLEKWAQIMVKIHQLAIVLNSIKVWCLLCSSLKIEKIPCNTTKELWHQARVLLRICLTVILRDLLMLAADPKTPHSLPLWLLLKINHFCRPKFLTNTNLAEETMSNL